MNGLDVISFLKFSDGFISMKLRAALALCGRIIRRHGGKTEAVGMLDESAEFKVYFRKM